MQTLNLECPLDKKINYLFPANPDHAKPLAHQPAGDLVHGGVGGRRHEDPDGRPPVAGGARRVPPVHDLQDEAGDSAGLARPRRTLDEGELRVRDVGRAHPRHALDHARLHIVQVLHRRVVLDRLREVLAPAADVKLLGARREDRLEERKIPDLVKKQSVGPFGSLQRSIKITLP